MKEEIIFPWITCVSDRFYKTFASDYLLEDLQFLSMNIDTEVNKALQKQSKDKTKSLFQVLINYYNHFCGKLKHPKDSFYLNVVCAKILSSLISIGLILSNGKTASKWIEQILFPIRMFPGNYETIYHSLLLVTNVKKKYHACYFVILRQLLCSELHKSVMDPETYMTVVLLCRRLRRISKKLDEMDVLSIVSKIEAPPNIMDWLFEKIGDIHLKKQKLFTKYLMTSKLPVSTLNKIRTVILKKWCLKNSAQEAIVQKREDELFVIDTGILSETKSVSTNLKPKKKRKKIASESVATNSKSKEKKEKMALKFSKKIPNNKKAIPTISRDLESYRIDLPEALKPLSCHCDALKQKKHKRKYEIEQLKNCQTLCSNCEKLVITVDCNSDTKSVRQVKKRKIVSEDCHVNDLISADKYGSKANASSSGKNGVSDIQSVKKRKKLKNRPGVAKHSRISVMDEQNQTDNFHTSQSSSELGIKTTTNQQNEEVNSSNTHKLFEESYLNTEIPNVNQDKNLTCTISKELPATEEMMQPSTQVSLNSNAESEIELVSQNFDTNGIHTKKSAITSKLVKIGEELTLTNDNKSSVKDYEERILKHSDEECSVNFKERKFSDEESSTHLGHPNIISEKDLSSTVTEKKTNPIIVQCESDSGDTISCSQNKMCLPRTNENDNELTCEKVVVVNENKSDNVVNVSTLKDNMNLTEDLKNVENIKGEGEVIPATDLEINHGKEENIYITKGEVDLHSHSTENVPLSEKKSEFHLPSVENKHGDSTMENIKESSTHSEQLKIVAIEDQSAVCEEETNPSVVQSKNDSGDVISRSQKETDVSREDTNANQMINKKGENQENVTKDSVAVLPSDLKTGHDKEKDIPLSKGKSELHSHSMETVPLLKEKSEFLSHRNERKQSHTSTIENIKELSPTRSRLIAVNKEENSTISEQEDNPSVVQCRNDFENAIPCSQNEIYISLDANAMPNKEENNLENISRDSETVLSADLEINHDKKENISLTKRKPELHSPSTENVPLVEKSELHSPRAVSKQSTIENINEGNPTHSRQSKIVATIDQSCTVSDQENNLSVVLCRKDYENTIPCSQSVSIKDENSNNVPEKKDIFVDDSKCKSVINISYSKDSMKLTENISNVEKITKGHEVIQAPDLEINYDKEENKSLAGGKSELHSGSTESIPLLGEKSEFPSHGIENQQSCDSPIENIDKETSTHSGQAQVVAIKDQSMAIPEEENNPSVVQFRSDSKNSIPSTQNETVVPIEDASANQIPNKKQSNLDNITSNNEAALPADLEINHDDDTDISLPKEKPEFDPHSSKFKQSHDSTIKTISQCEGVMKSPRKTIQYGDSKLIRKYSCSPCATEGIGLGLSSSDSEYVTLEEVNEGSEEFVFVESSDSVDEVEMSKSSISTGETNKQSKCSSKSISLNLRSKRNNLSSDEQQSAQSQSKQCSTDENLVNSVSFPDSVASKQYLSFAEVSKNEKKSLRSRTSPSVQSTCQRKSDSSEKNVHYTDNVSSKYNIEATTSNVSSKISVIVEFSKKKSNELDFDNAENFSVRDSKKQLCLVSRTEDDSNSEKNTKNETPPYALRSTRSHTVPCSEVISIPSTDVGDSETSNKKSPQVSFEVKVNMGQRCDEKESLSILSIEPETHPNSETSRNIALHKNDSSASMPTASCIENSVSHEKNSNSIHHEDVIRKPVTRSSRQEAGKMSTDLNHSNDTLSMNKKEYNLSNMRVTNLFFENVRDETDSIHSQESYSSVGSNIIESDNSDTSDVAQIERKKTLRSRNKKEKSTSNVKPKIYSLRRKNVNTTESSSQNSQLGIDLSTLSLKSPCIKIPVLSIEKTAVDKSAIVSSDKVSKEISKNVFSQGKIELSKRETRSSMLKAAQDEEKLEEKSTSGSYNLRPKRNIIAPSRLKL